MGRHHAATSPVAGARLNWSRWSLDTPSRIAARVAAPGSGRRGGLLRALVLILVASIGLFGIAGCRDEAASGGTVGDAGVGRTADGRLLVAVSILPQQWMVQQIGGERVEVIPLVQPGDSPHSLQPTEKLINDVMNAAVYFRIGVAFERGAWFEAIGNANRVRIIDTRQGVTLRSMGAHVCEDPSHNHAPGVVHGADEHDHGSGLDPHIWLDPALLKVQARTMAEGLIAVDPANEAAYRDGLARLEAELDRVDAEIRATLAPVSGRAFFVFHPAWGYFADAYGLEQIAIENEGKEPSDAELTTLKETALEHGAKVIFVQPQIAGRSAKALAEVIGGRVEVLDPLAPEVSANLLRAAQAIANAIEG